MNYDTHTRVRANRVPRNAFNWGFICRVEMIAKGQIAVARSLNALKAITDFDVSLNL